jgi:hypothetical protein
MKATRGPVLLFLASVAGSGTGCSFWAVRGPDHNAARGGDCTSSVAAPVVDGVLAAAALTGGALAANAPSCQSTGPWSCFLDLTPAEHGAGVALIGLGVLEAAAATYGGIKVAACHEMKARLAIPASQLRPAPGWSPGTNAAP